VPTLFERFVRGAGDRGGSFGLGLAIVKAVAVSHGGDVVLESPASGGARFVVTLPANSEPAPGAPGDGATGEGVGARAPEQASPAGSRS
jgi:signal transduction histidine kinase